MYIIFQEKLWFSQKQPQEMSYQKGVLKNFAKFKGKQLCQNLLFNKVVGRRPVNFAKFLRTPPED